MRRTHHEFQVEAPFDTEVAALPSLRVRAAFRLASRKARALCAPQHLLLGAVLVLGWAALIAWTGNGAIGWQGRLCADPDAAHPACRVAAPLTDGKVL